MSDDHTYREGFEYRFSTLDPHSAHVDPPAVAVYQTLLVRRPDGEPGPSIARSWDIAADGLSWTLVLREGLRFHSGAPCDAAAVVAALDALRWQMQVLPGGRQLWYWDPVDRVEVVDPQRVRIHLHYPHARLYTLLWGTHTAIHNEAARLRAPAEFGTTIADGTGPYRLRRWSPSAIEAVRVDRRPGRAATATWLSFTSAAERLAALVEGRVDCVHALDAAGLERLADDRRFGTARQAQPSSMYLSLNWQRTDLMFDDQAMRIALSRAIDRDRLVRDGLGGLGQVATGPLPPSHEFHRPVHAPERPDPTEAVARLEHLGWTTGAAGVRERDGRRLSFTCVTQRDDVFERIARLVAEDLRQVGAEMTIRTVPPFADFYDAVRAGPDASISKWLWPDPVEALKGFAHSSTTPFPNWQHSCVAALDAAFEAFLRATTAQEHQRWADVIQAEFIEGVPYLPLLTPDDVWAWRSEVRGFEPRPGDLYPRYDDVDVAEHVSG